MKKTTIFLSFLGISLASLSFMPPAFASFCTRDKSKVINNYYESDAVFVAKFVEVLPLDPINSSGRFSSSGRDVMKFEVQKEWKGELGAMANVLDFRDDSLGYDFHLGESYLIFADKTDSGYLVTDDCFGNKLLGDASSDIDILNSKYKPVMYFWDYRILAFSVLGISFLSIIAYFAIKRKNEKINNQH